MDVGQLVVSLNHNRKEGPKRQARRQVSGSKYTNTGNTRIYGVHNPTIPQIMAKNRKKYCYVCLLFFVICGKNKHRKLYDKQIKYANLKFIDVDRAGFQASIWRTLCEIRKNAGMP